MVQIRVTPLNAKVTMTDGQLAVRPISVLNVPLLHVASIDFLLICERAERTPSGPLNVFGILDRVVVEAFPAPVNLCMVAKFRGRPGEQVRLSFRLELPNGKRTDAAPDEAIRIGSNGSFIFVGPFASEWPAAGVYAVSLMSEGRKIGSATVVGVELMGT